LFGIVTYARLSLFVGYEAFEYKSNAEIICSLYWMVRTVKQTPYKTFYIHCWKISSRQWVSITHATRFTCEVLPNTSLHVQIITWLKVAGQTSCLPIIL